MEGRFDNKAAPQEIVQQSPRSSAVVDTWINTSTDGEYAEGTQYANGKIILKRTNIKRNKNPFIRTKRKVQIIEYSKDNISNQKISFLKDLKEITAIMERAKRVLSNNRIGK